VARSSIASTDVLAFMSLARLSTGNGSRQDVFALVASLLGSIVPGASIAFYLGAPGANVLTAVEAVGPAAERVRGLRIREGDRLTGWVAANRRAIVNSDAALDLGERAGANAGGEWLKTCLSVPLEVGSTLEGVLTIYAGADCFTDEQANLVQVLAPHIAQALHAANAAADAPRVQASRDLKLVSAR
jgi:GAF domain-containing protein